ALGRAAADEAQADRPQVLIIRDTRESGPMLEGALAAGVAQGGGDALIAGVAPTPAASILVRRLGLDLAVVVSASHNPWQDNGIKFFGRDGAKLSDEAEERIEAAVDSGLRPPTAVGQVRVLHGGSDDYLRELEGAFRTRLDGLRVVLDCANGSTHAAAPEIFRRAGADVDVLHADPDGRNINEGCGSTHPESVAERVVASGAHIGFAFDGDGDRVVAVDAAGDVRDGDELLVVAARHLAESGELGGGVAVTVMSNFGFHRAMEDAGIEVSTTHVGDRHVAEELRERGWTLGGEQSGHIIWTGFAPTGDGIAAALLTCRALAGRPLADAIPMQKLPQTLINVRVEDRGAIEDAREFWDEVDRESAALEGRGRVLVRPSGTEPIVRVMVEAPTPDECDAVAERLRDAVPGAS
ncbi:MAG: phosphoglucosamine mutase, partial [Actinomycetota bacterium]|nr:phosphoglucosamine mutase [Actinomycetota bacterium]